MYYLKLTRKLQSIGTRVIKLDRATHFSLNPMRISAKSAFIYAFNFLEDLLGLSCVAPELTRSPQMQLMNMNINNWER